MSFLEFKNMSKTFPGVTALDDVSVAMERGSVHGLVGENGAGKSTLLKILSGFYQPSGGSIVIGGETQKFATPFHALKSGVNVIQQELQLVPNQTVAENIALGHYASKSGFVSWNKLFSDARAFLDEIGVHINERAKISALTIGQQQMVEIAKAVKRDATIIAFDEPTSSLSKLETDLLFAMIRKLREQGKVIVYISHRMAEIFELCDSCTVLKDGRHVATHRWTSDSDRVTRDELIKEMTGRELRNIYDYRPRPAGDIVLEADNITGAGLSEPCSINARGGEIVGLFGLIGAGRSELVRAIYDPKLRASGAVRIDGFPMRQKKVKDSVRQGIMFCTEDRKKEGIVNGRSIWENINISCRRHFSFLRTCINRKKEFANARAQVDALAIKTPDIFRDVVQLSGGNQQKVILGRWLSERGMKMLIVDEPTRGIDVSAKNEIYNILYSLAEQGIGIVVVSSELPEIMGICDRLYVMREGAIATEIARADFTETKILEYAFPKDVNV